MRNAQDLRVARCELEFTSSAQRATSKFCALRVASIYLLALILANNYC